MNPEYCEHPTCAFEQRLDYCQPSAADPSELLGIVIDKMDDVLYDSNYGIDTSFYCTSDRDEQITERHFSHLSGNFKTWVWPLVETQLAINCVTDKILNRDQYRIAVSWLIQQAGVAKQPFTTHYAIDVYSAAPAQTSVEAISIIDGSWESRPMTNFDLSIVYGELDLAANAIHAAQQEQELLSNL